MKIFSYGEFYIGIIVAMLPVGLCAMLRISPSILDSFVFFALYSLFIMYFKIGKPEGYLEHFLQHLQTPEDFRPGHKPHHFPIIPDSIPDYLSKVQRTPAQLWEAQQANQYLLLENDVVPADMPGQYLLLDTTNELGAELKKEFKQYLDEGNVIGYGPKPE